MKKHLLGSLGCMGIAMAIYAGLWTVLCEKTGLISWIGFAGCTTYFACGKKYFRGVGSAILINLSGVMWGMMSIALNNIWKTSYSGILICAFISYIIIMQAKIQSLKFIPGAYIGCFITFAAEGNCKELVPAIILGSIMGGLTDITAEKVYQWSVKKQHI